MIVNGNPIGAAIWGLVSKFEVEDHISCDAQGVVGICNGLKEMDPVTGVLNGVYTGSEATGLLQNGTVDELLCSFNTPVDPEDDLWWTQDPPCDDFQSPNLDAYINYTPLDSNQADGMWGVLNDEGSYECDLGMKPQFRQFISDWVWGEKIGLRAAEVYCSTMPLLCYDLISCSICVGLYTLDNDVILSWILATALSNACTANLEPYNYTTFNEDYIANLLR